MQSDRRDHQAARHITADHGGWATARSEHPFERTLVDAACRPEVLDHPDDAPADGHVPHQLGGPGIDLVVGLTCEPGPVLVWIG
jgi:hypothetical protein